MTVDTSSSQQDVTSSPTSYSSNERDKGEQATQPAARTPTMNGFSGAAPGSGKPGTPGAGWPAAPSPWGQPRRPPGLGASAAIGAERSSSVTSPAVTTPITAGNDWFPPLGKDGSISNMGKGFPGSERRAAESQNSDNVVHLPSGLQRSVSSAAIGSERRQASEANSVRSSRPASPSASIPSLHQSPTSAVRSPSSATAATSLASAIASSLPHVNETSATPQASGNGHSIGSSASELESAFDAMLRGSSVFQDLVSRVKTMETQVGQLMAHTHPSANGSHFDPTPTRSPSVANSIGSTAFLTAPTSGSRPHSLHIPNNAISPSIASSALHSPAPADSQAPGGYSNPPNLQTTSVDREVIRQLTAQLSTLGNNVAQLMAQQQPHTPAVSTPGITPSVAPGGGSWPFDGHPHHPAHGRPNLSNLRAASDFVARGPGMPRPAPMTASVYGEERDARKRNPMNLQAPTPVGMGSRRHSADIIENMHNAAEGMPPTGHAGPGMGGQSLLGKWETLGVSGDLLRAIVKYGIGPPSKIQMKAIPCVLNTQDIVAQASSIQERIQCYVIPALQHVYTNMAQAHASMSESQELSPAMHGVQVLILTATIDQAGQAHRMCLGLGQTLGISSSLVVGQGDVSSELAQLSSNPPHVLVGTPQKLLDLLTIRSIPVDNLSLLIIDEMDQLIARNLSEYVNNVAKLLPPPISPGSSGREKSPSIGPNGFKPFEQGGSPVRTPHERQTAIFSCTVPQEVLNFASALNLREPVRVLVRRENNQDNAPTHAPNLRSMKHFFLYLAMGNTAPGNRAPGAGRQELSSANREWKLEALADLCCDADFTHGVVYCSSLDSVEAVTFKLASRNIDALALHGDMGAQTRHVVVSKFRSGNARGIGIKRVLVVYDALCRTLSDIHQVALVVNFDLPRAVEDYMHRVTCAASSGYGRAGTSVNIVSSALDIEMLRAIESFYHLKINELPPSLSTIC